MSAILEAEVLPGLWYFDCAGCEKRNLSSKPVRCVRCKAQKYCSVKLHWKLHRKVCKPAGTTGHAWTDKVSARLIQYVRLWETEMIATLLSGLDFIEEMNETMKRAHGRGAPGVKEPRILIGLDFTVPPGNNPTTFKLRSGHLVAPFHIRSTYLDIHGFCGGRDAGCTGCERESGNIGLGLHHEGITKFDAELAKLRARDVPVLQFLFKLTLISPLIPARHNTNEPVGNYSRFYTSYVIRRPLPQYSSLDQSRSFIGALQAMFKRPRRAISLHKERLYFATEADQEEANNDLLRLFTVHVHDYPVNKPLDLSDPRVDCVRLAQDYDQDPARFLRDKRSSMIHPGGLEHLQDLNRRMVPLDDSLPVEIWTSIRERSFRIQY